VFWKKKRKLERYMGIVVLFNFRLTNGMIYAFCPLGSEQSQLMKQAYETYPLNMRTYDKIIRLARTIADLEGEDWISTMHLAEALQYRELNSFYRQMNDSIREIADYPNNEGEQL